MRRCVWLRRTLPYLLSCLSRLGQHPDRLWRLVVDRHAPVWGRPEHHPDGADLAPAWRPLRRSAISIARRTVREPPGDPTDDRRAPKPVHAAAGASGDHVSGLHGIRPGLSTGDHRTRAAANRRGERSLSDALSGAPSRRSPLIRAALPDRAPDPLLFRRHRMGPGAHRGCAGCGCVHRRVLYLRQASAVPHELGEPAGASARDRSQACAADPHEHGYAGGEACGLGEAAE